MRKLVWLLQILLLAGSMHSMAQGKSKMPDPAATGKLLINEMLSRKEFMMYNSNNVVAVHYAEVAAAYGALQLAGKIRDTSLLKQLAKRYQRVIDEKIVNTANHVDANVVGIWPLELYLRTHKEQYLKDGLALADGQWKDTLPGNLSSQTRYWIDDIYMIGCLQVQAFRATGNAVYLDRAAIEIASYIKKLQQPNGLFFHGPEAPFFWGRGNGWVAAGFAELLSELPATHPQYAIIQQGYLKMMQTLLATQGADGMWHQLIDHPESFKETSCTAMFAFAMQKGIQMKLLKRSAYRKAVNKSWKALHGYIDSTGRMRNVCVGTGQSRDVQYYLSRPVSTGDFHGQAPMIWLANALLQQ
ncbi:MAG TPA: glycoside hydrolase family 88 protein [Phnomibacter sp.]|nr:glycoside hydrolase family 88 protein [Phnomibacter sp.]